MTNSAIVRYTVIIYILSWAVQLIAIYATESINSKEAELLLLLTMPVPAAVTIIYIVRNKALRAGIWWKPNRNILKLVISHRYKL